MFLHDSAADVLKKSFRVIWCEMINCRATLPTLNGDDGNAMSAKQMHPFYTQFKTTSEPRRLLCLYV